MRFLYLSHIIRLLQIGSNFFNLNNMRIDLSVKTTKKIIPAKICFEHIGGKLGMMLMELFVVRRWIAKVNPKDKHYYITSKGQREFTKLGLDMSQIKSVEPSV
jgi:hypothetical protein